MTTIAYRDGVMAADTMSNDGTLRVSMNSQKIYRVFTRFSIVACAGYVAEAEAFIEWLERGVPDGDKLKVSENFDAIEVACLNAINPGAVWHWDDHLTPYKLDAEFYALGNGGHFAMGAMAAGCTAEEAVRLAIKHTIHSGGDIQIERITDFDRKVA